MSGKASGSQCDPKFVPYIESFERAGLGDTLDAVFGLWPELTLAYLNAGWFAFAAANGGEPAISQHWGLGRSVLDAIPDPLAPFYRRAFRTALSSESPWQHEYECSSPTNLRRFVERVYPLAGGAGLLVVNSLVVECPHPRDPNVSEQPAARDYVDEHHLIRQCMHCRRIRRNGERRRWDWIPAWVTEPPENTSHGLCEVCFRYYYPEYS